MIKNKRQSNIFKKLFARKPKTPDIITIDSLLSQDYVDDAINILRERQSHIKSLMIIHVNKDDTW